MNEFVQTAWDIIKNVHNFFLYLGDKQTLSIFAPPILILEFISIIIFIKLTSTKHTAKGLKAAYKASWLFLGAQALAFFIFIVVLDSNEKIIGPRAVGGLVGFLLIGITLPPVLIFKGLAYRKRHLTHGSGFFRSVFSRTVKGDPLINAANRQALQAEIKSAINVTTAMIIATLLVLVLFLIGPVSALYGAPINKEPIITIFFMICAIASPVVILNLSSKQNISSPNGAKILPEARNALLSYTAVILLCALLVWLANNALWLVAVTATFLTDLFLLPVLIKKNYVLNNYYYVFHQKYGPRRATILKIFLAGLFFLSFVKQISFVMVVYILYFNGLLADAIVERARPQIPPAQEKNNLDCLVGLLLYPLRGQNNPSKLFDYKSAPFKWSWPAFLLPELWFLYHEMLPLGFFFLFLAAFFLFALAGSLSYYAMLSAPLRILCGFYASKLHFARHGRLP